MTLKEAAMVSYRPLPIWACCVKIVPNYLRRYPCTVSEDQLCHMVKQKRMCKASHNVDRCSCAIVVVLT